MPPRTSSARYSVEGICLKARIYGESDRILTIYGPTTGKIAVFAKGVRKSGSTLSGACQLFSHQLLQLKKGLKFDLLSQYQTQESFPNLSKTIAPLAFAQLFSETLSACTPEHDPDSEALFQALLNGLRQLNQTEEELSLSHISLQFHQQLLTLTGYQPQLESCILCGKSTDLSQLYHYFSSVLGGVSCMGCGRASDTVRVLSSSLAYLIEPHEAHWQEANPHKLHRFLHHYLTQKLGRPIRAFQFLEQTLWQENNLDVSEASPLSEAVELK